LNQSTKPASDLSKQRKELDAREAYLAAREKIAEETEAAITKGQNELALLDATIVARELILKQQQDRLNDQDKLYISNTTKLQLKQEKEQDKLVALQEKVAAAKVELEATKASIQERKDYQKQQEELIAKQSEDGNLQLRSLEYEIIESKQVIKDLEQKRRNLYEEGQTLESDLEAARNSFAPELEEHEAAVVVIVQRKEVLETDLQVAQKKIYDTNIELNKLLLRRKQIHADVDAKLQLLDAKEREIMAKREALRQEREEMEETKHYYQSPKSLYDTI
jgi:hypothetical protein